MEDVIALLQIFTTTVVIIVRIYVYGAGLAQAV
jgi:hypothetical protein